MARATSGQEPAPHYTFEDVGENEADTRREEKAEQQLCKKKKARSIRRGIEAYFDRKQLKQNLGEDGSDDDLDYFEDSDEWYH